MIEDGPTWSNVVQAKRVSFLSDKSRHTTGASHVVDGRGRPREGHARLQRNLREKEKCRRQLQRAGPQETFPENSSQGIGELPKFPESSDYCYSIAYGASGLVYQGKGLKTRHMLACQEEWASPGQEPPGKTRFSVKALRIGKQVVSSYDYVVVAVHHGKLINFLSGTWI